MCKRCGSGLRIKNAGRAIITKRAKADVIPTAQWQRMTQEWEQSFPSG
jgi:hypothetical protein